MEESQQEEVQEERNDQSNEVRVEQELPESYKSWELNAQEVRFLNELYKEIQDAQGLADGLKQESDLPNEAFNKAQKDVETVQNLIEVIREESDKEDNIKFAVDNALLTLATGKRRLEDENEHFRNIIRDRNVQLRMLLLKVRDQEKQIKQKDDLIQKLEKQTQVQSQTLRQLQNKVEDEHRFKVVQEQLRQPKPKNFYDEAKYVDVKGDPFDFWQSNAPVKNFEYPGEPQKLNDIISKKTLWVAQDVKLPGNKKF
ncbi:hypothetical protein pb186bvf_011655 [Paramecium bursaria]